MLKLFKSHLAFVPVVIIVAFMLVLRLDVLLSSYSTNLWQVELAPFSLFFKNIVGQQLILNKYFNLSFSAILVFFQAGIIISIFELYKNNELKSFIPAWIFVLIMHLNPDLLYLSPQLFSSTFILLAFRKLIVFVENNNKQKAIFDIALFIGIAGMFWMPSYLFLLFVLFFLNKKSKLNIRIFLSIFFTAIIPLLYVFTYYYLTDQWSLNNTIFKSLEINKFEFSFYPLSLQLSGIVLLLVSVSSIYFVVKFVSKQLMDIKGLFFLILIFIINVFIVYFFQNDNNISILIFLFFPTSIFISILFNRIKRNIVAEFIHLVLLLSVIVNFINFT